MSGWCETHGGPVVVGSWSDGSERHCTCASSAARDGDNDRVRERVASEAACHRFLIGVDQRLVLCTCGWRDLDEANLSRPARRWALHVADALLAGSLRQLVAERDEAVAAVQRARKLIAFYDRHEYGSLEVDDLRRALDGRS